MAGSLALATLPNHANNTFYGGGEKGYTDYPMMLHSI
jgi:hypothetical protein